MSRALLISTLAALCWCNAAHAQDEPFDPPAPNDSPAPRARDRATTHAPSVVAQPAPEAAPEAAPPLSNGQPPAEAVEEPAPPPPPPLPSEAVRPRQRYEGEVSTEGAPAYDDERDNTDDAAHDSDDSHDSGFSMPGFSIRIDPFNWLLEGRLGLELEVVAWKFISVELVPVFVASTEPPSFNFSGRDDPISQHSNGIGPISGASLGAGFWLSGTPLSGYVLRALLTNYGYTYEAKDGAGVFDRVNHTERRLVVLIGSHSRFGAFTLAGGIGLGYELNQQQRCIVNRGSTFATAATSGCADDGELQIEVERDGSTVADLNGSFHPVYLVGRFSLGVSFD